MLQSWLDASHSDFQDLALHHERPRLAAYQICRRIPDQLYSLEVSAHQGTIAALQDTYNWAVGKGSETADKASSAAKDAEAKAGDKASDLQADADKDASQAKKEAKGYVAAAQDAAKVGHEG